MPGVRGGFAVWTAQGKGLFSHSFRNGSWLPVKEKPSTLSGAEGRFSRKKLGVYPTLDGFMGLCGI